MTRRVHLVPGWTEAMPGVPPPMVIAACGTHPRRIEHTTTDGARVTCRRCRQTQAWRHACSEAGDLQRRTLRALAQDDDTVDCYRRVLGLLDGGTPAQLVALDRWLEGPDTMQAARALAAELAPVHPGWEDVERAGEVWPPPAEETP